MLADHRQDDGGERPAATDLLHLPEHLGRLGERPDFSIDALQGTKAKSASNSRARLVSELLPGPSAMM